MSTSLLQIYGASTALLRKNKCSTYSKYVSALFLLAPCICTVSLQKRWMCVSTSLLVQRSTSVYFAEHKFDRCQTCFYLIHAASVPMFKRHCRLNIASFAKGKTLLLKMLNVAEPPTCPYLRVSILQASL